MTIRTFALTAALAVAAASAGHAQETAAPAVAGAGAGAAAPAPAAAPAAAEAPRPARRVSRDLIRAADLVGSPEANALAVVQRHNAQWLRPRGSSSISRPEQVVVHINNVPSGGVDALRRVATAEIVELRHLDGMQATQRFGTGYGAGVILVTTR